MSKFITRTYSQTSVDSINKADLEHLRLINSGYRVLKTTSSPFTCTLTYGKC